MQVKDQIIAALQKDISRRYISICNLQSDGRLHLDQTCISLLKPKNNEEFSIINDKSSIIIVRNPSPFHKEKVLSKTKWDSKQKRLRLSQNALRILLTCQVGFRAFKYGSEIALEAEPYLAPPSTKINASKQIEDLAPYVLRSSRDIVHLEIFSEEQVLKFQEFKLVGEYWIQHKHQDPLDSNFELINCKTTDCAACSSNFPIIKTLYWFPALFYNNGYPRPGLLSFTGSTIHIGQTLVDECKAHRTFIKKRKQKFDKYMDNGNTSYKGKVLFSISDGFEFDKKDSEPFTIQEKGLMKIALKELVNFTMENVKI